MRGMLLAGACTAALLAFGPVARAQLDAPGAQLDTPGAAPESLPDIVVTSEKRAEKQNEVPGAVSAFTGDALDAIQARGLTDIQALTPGLVFSGGGQGFGTVTLRGITTGSEPSPLVGIVVDGVPYGSSSAFALGGLTQLDIDLWDVDRVEVLRGPQGTLYGASSLGGLLSYTAHAPSLTKWDAKAETELSGVDHGGLDYTLRAAFGGPLVDDRVGLRIAVSHEDDHGFIDNPVVGKSGIDDLQQTTLRPSLLFKPDDRLSVQISGIYQNDNRGSNDSVVYSLATSRPVAGELEQGLARLEPSQIDYKQLSTTVGYAFDWATLTSITSYAQTKLVSSPDYSATILGLADRFPGLISPLLAGIPGAPTTAVDVKLTVNKFVQEVRLASPDAGMFRWLVGGFYTEESPDELQSFDGYQADGKLSPLLGPSVSIRLNSSFREYAGFGNVTYAPSDLVDLTFGLRYSANDQTYQQTTLGLFAPALGTPGATPRFTSSEDQVTYLITGRYHLGPDSILYARAASGYRPGGPNVVIPGAPSAFKSDTLWNYEAGYKARAWDGRVDLSVDAFYIDWADIQVVQSNAQGLTYRDNGHGATSRGFEGSVSVLPVAGLTLTATAAYTQATLNKDEPALGAHEGERLPDSPRWQASLVGDYLFPIGEETLGFVGATVRHVGDRTISFSNSTSKPNFTLPDYTMLDLRAGIEAGRYTLTAFVRNATNERALLSGDSSLLTRLGQVTATVARPLTAGVVLAAKF